MKLLDKICEELGVEVGEEWLGNNGRKYKIFKTGDLMIETKYSGWIVTDNRYLLTGKVKPAWRPNQGEYYYIADATATDLYDAIGSWDNSEWEISLLERGLIFKTKEEAIECAKKMLSVVE